MCSATCTTSQCWPARPRRFIASASSPGGTRRDWQSHRPLDGRVVVGVARSLVLMEREQQARQIAQLAEDRAEDAFERERRESYFHRITLADRDLAVNLLAECPGDLRGWEWHYLMRLCRFEPLIIQDKS